MFEYSVLRPLAPSDKLFLDDYNLVVDIKLNDRDYARYYAKAFLRLDPFNFAGITLVSFREAMSWNVNVTDADRQLFKPVKDFLDDRSVFEYLCQYKKQRIEADKQVHQTALEKLLEEETKLQLYLAE